MKKKQTPSSGKISVTSVIEHRKFKHQEKASYDKQQFTFSSSGGIKPNPSKVAVVELPKVDFTKNVTCPICLSWTSLNRFLISTKKGYDKGTGKCPECGFKVKMKTLFGLSKWTPEEYAEFVIKYPSGAFFAKVQKVPFNTWKDRLRLMGWSTPFWNRYNSLKAGIERPDEEEMRRINQQADEYERDWKDSDEREKFKAEFDRKQEGINWS